MVDKERLVELAERLSWPLYKLILSATSVDMELRNEVDDRFNELRAALRSLSTPSMKDEDDD